MVSAVVGVARLLGNAKQYVSLCNPAQLLRLPGNLLTSSPCNAICLHYFSIVFLSCVICSHRHENGCTAAVEAPEVAVSQVPVFNVTTESDYDILFNCF